MKYLKYITLSLLLIIGFTSCSDDDKEQAPRLFRPVSDIEAKSNNVVLEWDLIKGATSYELILFKATGEETENGETIVKEYRKETTTESPFVFEGVEWDEKYAAKIKAIGSNIESEYYDTKLISVVYPTSLTTIRTIDVAALITWKTEGGRITSLKIVPSNNTDEEDIIVPVSETEYENGEIVVPNLIPNKSYQVYAYGGDSQTADTYEGRANFKTRESEDFEEMYGAGMYIDLREVEDEDILTSSDVQDKLKATEGMTVILRGGFTYKMGTAILFEKSATLRTGLTLEGNAVIVQAATFQLAKNSNVDKLEFEEINFISDKAVAQPIAKWEGDKGFGGRQVFNINGTSSTLNSISFTNCRIEGYRAIVRLQAASDGVKKVSFNTCHINGIGDQGAVTTNNQSATMDEVEFINSTITNVVMLADIRKSSNKPSMTVKDCTFCYAPIEAAATGNPLFRFSSNEATLLLENSIFGPSLATVGGGGSNPITYQAGIKEVAIIDGSKTSIGVKNSYKTNFKFFDGFEIGDLVSITTDEKGLFTDPEKENYTIKFNFDGAQSAGAIEWRMQ